MQILHDSFGNSFSFAGRPLEEGPLPSLFYFSLSAEESLSLHPYNTPVRLLQSEALRIFSFTLPGHGGSFDKFKAMAYWAAQLAEGKPFLESFLETTSCSIQWLIDQGIAQADKLAVAGLSRGAFVAAHLAAQHKNIHTFLGFAPLTSLTALAEFSNPSSSLKAAAEKLDLTRQIESLIHVKNLRFYIGNRDLRVNTDICYSFIRQLVERAHEKHIRHSAVELRLIPSVGLKGHGTPPNIFAEGVAWLKTKLLEAYG